MITFEEARAIVEAERQGLYEPDEEFYVRTYGYDGGDKWIVSYNSTRINDEPMTTVNKLTGEYQETYGTPSEESGTAVGDAPMVGFYPPP